MTRNQTLTRDASGQTLVVLRSRELSRPSVIVGRVIILIAFLAGWQYLPTLESARSVLPALDPFFISSPLQVGHQIVDLLQGARDFWAQFLFTLKGAGIGFVISIIAGCGLGLLMSNSRNLSAVLTLPLDLINVIPTVALIPVIVILFGASLAGSILTVFLAVFFYVFFNAYAGGASVPQELTQSAKLMGASRRAIMIRIRARYAIVWTIETLPGAVGRALIGAFSAELLSGSAGMGRLVLDSLLSLNSSLTFSVVVILSGLGAGLVGLANVGSKRYLHWWSGVR